MLRFFSLGLILLHQQISLADIPMAHYHVLGEKEKHAGETWSYEGENGPDNWFKNFPKCGGKMQSPIEIDRTTAQRMTMERIQFHGYDVKRSGVTIQNNGHSAELHLSEGEEGRPYIELGGLGARYTFTQLHFHWGRNDFEGSEHVLFPNYGRTLEIHFVHVNPDEAKDGRAGIAVVGMTFQATSRNNTDYASIVNVLQNIRYKGKKTALPDLALESLLPDWYHRSHFFRYNGSLTTPPCTEGVIWSVFEDPNIIGKTQIQQFRTLFRSEEGEEEEEMAYNFRPVQALNDRTVYRVHASKSELHFHYDYHILE